MIIERTKILSYRDLEVWKKSVFLTVEIYRITKNFPQIEIYGITSQIRRASVGIPSSIAEGRSRGHIREYIQYLNIAYGSAAELDTQLLIAKQIGYLSEKDYNHLYNLLVEIMKMLNGLIHKLQPTT